MVLFQRILLLLIAASFSASAYETTTHRLLSDWSYDRSVLADPSKQIYLDLGLINTPADSLPTFQNSDLILRQSIKELVKFGAEFEDRGRRPLNHFYDPQNFGRGGAGSSAASPDWILEDNFNVSGQEFSLKDANESFYDALTSPLAFQRNRNWGRTFQTLGQVIHHIQDMAQPQHVRDDDHCVALLCLPTPLYKPSLYEVYTAENHDKLRAAMGAFNYTNVDLQTFNKARNFWDGSGSKNGYGLAEFTSTNFVSSGTNFRGGNLIGGVPVDVMTDPEFPLPSTNNLQVSNRNVTDVDLLGPNQPLIGNIQFVGSPILDSYRASESGFNFRTSSFSVFDSDLDNIDTQMNFALTKFNFDAAYEFLIPRAVSYGTGLIDYFFRGRLEAELTNNNDTIEITNVSDGSFSFQAGTTLEFFYETESGERKVIESLSTVLPNNLPVNGAYTITDLAAALESITDMGIERKLFLVLDGDIGSERGIAATVIQLPQFLPFLRTLQTYSNTVTQTYSNGEIYQIAEVYNRAIGTFYLYEGAVFEHEIYESYITLRNLKQEQNPPYTQFWETTRSVNRASQIAKSRSDSEGPLSNSISVLNLPARLALSSVPNTYVQGAPRIITQYDPAAGSVLDGLNLGGAIPGPIDGSLGGAMAAPRLASFVLPPLDPLEVALLPRTVSYIQLEPCIGPAPNSCPGINPDSYYFSNPLLLHSNMGATVQNTADGLFYNSANCDISRGPLDLIRCRAGNFIDYVSGTGGTWRIGGSWANMYIAPDLQIPPP